MTITRPMRLFTIALISALVAGACGSSSHNASGGGSTSTLVIGDIWPYTGALADYGAKSQAGCLAAISVVNGAGGVLGHQLSCTEVDNKDDPVDAVAAVNKFFATTSNVVGISGPETDTSIATAKIIDNAHVPFLSYTGDTYFAKSTLKYFWDMALSDPEYGASIAYSANLAGYKRIAIVLGTNSGSQGLKTGLMGALKELGNPAVSFQSIPDNQPTYSTEVAALAGSHPDAIIGEASPTSMATFITNLKSQYHMVPVITSFTDLTPDLFKALNNTIGVPDLEQYLRATSSQVAASGAGYDDYSHALTAIAANYPKAGDAVHSAQAEYTYDTVLLYALAMNAAKSTKPTVYNDYILKVGNPSPGAVDVATYAQGVSELKAGKTIRYQPLSGPLNFNQYHSSTPPLFEYKFTGTGDNVPLPDIKIDPVEIGKLVAGL